MKKSVRLLAALLCFAMLFGMIPAMAINVAAAANEKFANSQLSIVEEGNSTLAPGITQDSYTVYDKNGDQVKMFITTADMSVDTVKLFASYKDMDPINYGMSKLTEQVASFNEKAEAGDAYYQGTVVAGINASYYNMITGKPTGTFVMNGIDVTTESEGNAYGYFAVMKDGSVKIGNKGDYSKDKGNIQEAIGIYTMLIVDGKICAGLDAKTKYPRQTIGITADGDVILMTADGNQAPKSIGLTIQEQAEVMLDLGCVWAGHLDGGGSCTYAAKAEGSNDFKIVNSPSDGSERSVSNGFIMVSTAVSDGKFASAALTAANEYVTPGSTVAISAIGVDKAGGAAEIPADIAWQMKDASMGTVANGVFTASNKTGAAVVQMVYGGKVVGETTINVVIPDSIAFGNSEMVVPYGKTVNLNISAKYGIKDVALKPSDVVFTLSDTTIGSISGFEFTAGAEGVAAAKSTLTAKLSFAESITAATNITLGKGSEVVYDFEDGTNQNVIVDETPGTQYNYVWPETNQTVVDATTGKVHSGNYALGAVVDYSNSLESGYMKTSIYATETKVFENAVAIGVWIYIPDEFVGLWARWTLLPATIDADGKPVFSGSTHNSNLMDTGNGGTGVVYTFDEPGWHYLWADTSMYPAVGWRENTTMIQLYISDRDGAEYGYTASEQSNIPGKFQIYLDDFTVDYSTAVDDREAPVFSNVTYATEGMADAAALNGQTITTNKVTIAASVAENTTKSNFTGLDESTIKAYIDGVEYEATYANGKVSINDVVLTNGKHTIKFSACDKMGNYGYIYQYITVNAENSGSTVKLVPTDATAKYIKLSSIYNMDLVATAIEEVESVEVVIDLDNNSTWQLDHMTLADGFEATYAVDSAENIATIIITRTGKNTQTGEAALATLPVRVWTLKTGYIYENGTKVGLAALTLAQFKAQNEFWRMSVIATVDKGVLTRVNNSVDTFTGERVFCDTEMWGNYAAMTKSGTDMAYYNAWDGGHVHTPAAIDDKDPTCTTKGYTDRTFCEGCNSVVDWGKTVEATGHTYTLIAGEYKCVGCDDNFGDYTGLVHDDVANVDYYLMFGQVSSGWFMIKNEWYYFIPETFAAAQGSVTTTDGITFDFVDGKVQGPVWEDWYVYKRCWYGPDYYRNISKNVQYLMTEIDGEIYFFNNAGCMQTGLVVSHESNKFDFFCYDCGTDGKGVPYTGIAENMYFENALQVKDSRLVEANGQYYQIKKTGVMYPSTVILTDTLTGVVFSSDGKIYYAENGYIVCKGAVKVNGDIYYFGGDYAALADGTHYLSGSRLNGLLPAGSYEIKDGKIMISESKNGIVTENGKNYYYVNGVKQKGAFEIDEDIYYFSANYYALADGRYYISADLLNGLLPAGTYTIKDGKIVVPEVKNGIVEENGNTYYYVNGVKQKGAFEIGDDIYYFSAKYNALADGKYYISADLLNGLLSAGTYTIKDGKIVIPEVKNGIVEENGYTYYYENGAKKKGAVKIDGEIYYFSAKYYALEDGRYYISADLLNGLLSAGTYTIKDGKIVL